MLPTGACLRLGYNVVRGQQTNKLYDAIHQDIRRASLWWTGLPRRIYMHSGGTSLYLVQYPRAFLPGPTN